MKLKDITVLIGDDSILARKQIKDILIDLGITSIIEASNGDEVVKKYLEGNPDLSFVDIVMPIRDGISAIDEICSSHKDANIVVTSSVGTQTQLKKAIECGAKDFIQKPITSDKIAAILNSRFER